MAKKGSCKTCGKPTHDSVKGQCAGCYNSRGKQVKPPKLCPKCGIGEVKSGSAATICRACYDNRGQKPDDPVYCQLCKGRKVSKRGRVAYRFCSQCYAERRDECRAVTDGDGDPKLGIRKLLKTGPKSIVDIADALKKTPGQVLDMLLEMKASGVNVHEFGNKWSLESSQPHGGISERTLVSDKNGWHVIGATSDNHLCSKHERLDVLDDAYRIFENNGVKVVLNSGNWIDGEARFNKFELKVHGMDAQLQYLGQNYPQKKGMQTWNVAGDDHEGWYSQREGVDIGAYAELVMREGGRTDWINLGYMEAFIPLVHATTGKQSMYHLMHPGGGSAYATSYTVQKIVEGYEGGSKPAVLQAGHYHKTEWINVRNVWCLQPGCTQDQTTFARKRKLTFSLAATILALRQNPDTGAVEEAVCYQKHYFNQGYYLNNQWSLSGPVSQVPRIAL